MVEIQFTFLMLHLCDNDVQFWLISFLNLEIFLLFKIITCSISMPKKKLQKSKYKNRQ